MTGTSKAKAAYQHIERVRKGGYSIVFNNCMDHTKEILEAYGANNMPNPTQEWEPNKFFRKLLSPPWSPRRWKGLPNLSPTAILYNFADLVRGRTVSFDSGVRNSGFQGAEVFKVRWFVDGVSVGYGSHAGVPANSTVLNDNSAYAWAATVGTHTIRFAVDVDNHVLELNESNNSRSVTVVVP